LATVQVRGHHVQIHKIFNISWAIDHSLTKLKHIVRDAGIATMVARLAKIKDKDIGIKGHQVQINKTFNIP
jgi:hypothetical protein